MNLELHEQTAVVVGAAQGIGLAIARAFAAEGAHVALLDQDSRVIEAARVLGLEFNRASQPLVADVCDYQRMQRCAQTVQSCLGRIDHVAFCVGIGSGKFGFPFWNLTPGDWPRVLQVNLLGAVNVAHAFAPYLVEARSGTLLFLSSVAGQIGSQTDPPYSASKAALINFAQCAARDLARYDVRVNTLCPGMVETSLNRAVWQAWARQQPAEQRLSFEEWTAEKIRRVVPLGRWQTVEDIAALAVFLASARAANITGQTMNVDGGFVIR